MAHTAHLQTWWENKHRPIAMLALAAIALHVALRLSPATDEAVAAYPLYAALALGGIPLVADLLIKLLRREFGSDLLAGLSITTAVLLGEYLAGTLVVLMLSGGEAIESFAVRRASSVLQALAKRMPSFAHRKRDAMVRCSARLVYRSRITHCYCYCVYESRRGRAYRRRRRA